MNYSKASVSFTALTLDNGSSSKNSEFREDFWISRIAIFNATTLFTGRLEHEEMIDQPIFCYQFIVSAAFTFTFTYMPMTGKMTSSQQTANNYFYWLPSCCLLAWQRGVTTYNSFHQDTYKDNNDTCPMPTPSHTTTYDFFLLPQLRESFFFTVDVQNPQAHEIQ